MLKVVLTDTFAAHGAGHARRLLEAYPVVVLSYHSNETFEAPVCQFSPPEQAELHRILC